MEVRRLLGSDFDAALAKVDAWFGETVHEPVHPVFFHHFGGYAVEENGELIGFLIGFRSLRNEDIAYIHVVAVDPERRGQGIATDLYDRFERQAKIWGSYVIEAVADPDNEAAVRFHEHRGFSFRRVPNWAGPGQDRVVLQKKIGGAYAMRP